MPDVNPTVVINAPSQVAIEARPVPEPSPHELLVETRTTLISTGTELAIFDGLVGAIEYPFVPGYSNIGVVVEAGAEVEGDWQGRRVATPGPHAKYVAVDPSVAVPVVGSSTEEQLVFFSLAAIALNGLRRGTVAGGEVAAVFGLGLLGQFVLRFCRLFGMRPVIAVEQYAARCDLARRVPGVMVTGPESAEAIVAASTRGRMADVVFEVTGRQDAISGQVRCLREQGRFVVLGSPRGAAVPFDFYWGCHRRSLSIIGAHTLSHASSGTPATPWTAQRHAELYFDFLDSGDIDVGPLISEVVPYSDTVGAYHDLARDRGSHMGVVIDWRE